VVEDHGRVLATGRAVGDRVAVGRARVVRSTAELGSFRPGEVLVAETTTPDWEPVLGQAAAVVTERGGRTCHAAIVARELGLPAVVGTGDATTALEDGAEVSVSCAEGDTGHVYEGRAAVHVDRIDLSDLPRPRTRIMVNLGNPALALRTSMLPNDGVGLARIEFVISEMVKAHLNPSLDVSTILVTMYDARTRLAAGVAEEVRDHFGDQVLKTTIPRSVRVSEAPSYGQTVMTYDPGSPGALSYLEAAREIAVKGAAS